MRLLLCVALLFVACSPETPAAPVGADGVILSDFSLEDRNPSSSTYGQQVSPSAHRGEISAWYFSHVS